MLSFILADRSVSVSVTAMPTVHVEQRPDTIAWISLGVSVAVALVTLLLFIATKTLATETKRLADQTATMAGETAELARDTVDASDRADEHHQQSYWPLLVVRNANVTLTRQGPQLGFECTNVGTGPSPEATVRITGINGATPPEHLGSGIPPCGEGDTVNVSVNLQDNEVTSVAFRVEYQTIFTSIGATKWLMRRDVNGRWELGWSSPYEPPAIIRRASTASKSDSGTSV